MYICYAKYCFNFLKQSHFTGIQNILVYSILTLYTTAMTVKSETLVSKLVIF